MNACCRNGNSPVKTKVAAMAHDGRSVRDYTPVCFKRVTSMPKPPPSSVFLARWRIRSGLTQESLASLIGVHKGTVSRWEAGKRDMDMQDVQRVAAALGIEPMALFRSPEDHDAAKLIDRFARLVERLGYERAQKLLDALDDTE